MKLKQLLIGACIFTCVGCSSATIGGAVGGAAGALTGQYWIGDVVAAGTELTLNIANDVRKDEVKIIDRSKFVSWPVLDIFPIQDWEKDCWPHLYDL